MTVNPRCYCGGGLFAPWAALYGLLLRGVCSYTPAAVAPVLGVLVRCAGVWLYMPPLYFCKLFPLSVGYVLLIAAQCTINKAVAGLLIVLSRQTGLY